MTGSIGELPNFSLPILLPPILTADSARQGVVEAIRLPPGPHLRRMRRAAAEVQVEGMGELGVLLLRRRRQGRRRRLPPMQPWVVEASCRRLIVDAARAVQSVRSKSDAMRNICHCLMPWRRGKNFFQCLNLKPWRRGKNFRILSQILRLASNLWCGPRPLHLMCMAAP